jgi:hypothetical protein
MFFLSGSFGQHLNHLSNNIQHQQYWLLVQCSFLYLFCLGFLFYYIIISVIQVMARLSFYPRTIFIKTHLIS